MIMSTVNSYMILCVKLSSRCAVYGLLFSIDFAIDHFVYRRVVSLVFCTKLSKHTLHMLNRTRQLDVMGHFFHIKIYSNT